MNTRGVREGMTVHSADGEKLGKVIECGALDFVIEKGFFFPKDYLVRYEQVGAVVGEDVRLTTAAGALGKVSEGASTFLPPSETSDTEASIARGASEANDPGLSTLDRLREGTDAAGLGDESAPGPVMPGMPAAEPRRRAPMPRGQVEQRADADRPPEGSRDRIDPLTRRDPEE